MANGQGQAPYCLVNPKQPAIIPAAVKIPSIARATDLARAIQAINSLTQVVNMMTSTGYGNFTEVPGTRQTTQTVIYDPLDNEVSVTVNQITSLTFADGFGNTLNWTQAIGGGLVQASG